MKYNISNRDRILSDSLNCPEGLKTIINLKEKILEMEGMLDLFKESIDQCNRLIKYCNDKIMTEVDNDKQKQYETQKIVWEDNKLIWNISGFITLISIDVKTIQIGLYYSEEEWRKRFYARQICIIMYESSKKIFELLGRDFCILISNRINNYPFQDELNSIRERLNIFKKNHNDYLGIVRNNTAAHKDKNVLYQLEIISDISWSETINTTIEFEKIINDLGSYLSKIIKSVMVNLASSPMGKNII